MHPFGHNRIGVASTLAAAANGKCRPPLLKYAVGEAECGKSACRVLLRFRATTERRRDFEA